MNPRLGKLILGLSAAGYPLTELTIRRFGRRGAVIAEGVCVRLAIRDTAMVAAGAPARLRRGPALLLWLELGAAAAAAGLGLRLVPRQGSRRASREAAGLPGAGPSHGRPHALRPAHRQVLDLPSARSGSQAGRRLTDTRAHSAGQPHGFAWAHRPRANHGAT